MTSLLTFSILQGRNSEIPCGSLPRKDPVSGLRRRFALDEHLIDRRIRVWWDGNSDWFAADIIGYDPVKKLHKLQVMDDSLRFYVIYMLHYKSTVMNERARVLLFCVSKVL